uniref:Uncharacterized protein n=1 Tax=Candidatus Kentrum sp. MB TaxID=2138164 RepID=A0A450XAB9_9GAMM|nr:MAG: hypothetical protein BECKMB1821G_GA0114241_101920 [Candidatus Kentron sp. MB]
MERFGTSWERFRVSGEDQGLDEEVRNLEDVTIRPVIAGPFNTA